MSDAIIEPGSPLRGEAALPADKAICHRAVLLASLARGTTRLEPWPAADDCRRSLEAIEQFGVRTARRGAAIEVTGAGEAGWRQPSADVTCGESGTTMRLLAGLAAGQPFVTKLGAGAQLVRRPMRRVADPLRQMGARIEGSGQRGQEEVYPPLTIEGRRPLRAIRYEMPVASAQVKSAILLAGLFAEGPTTVIERHQTRDHTERALHAFGARVAVAGRAVTIEPGPLTSPGRLVLPGDVSSAAFFLVAALIVPGSQITLRDVGLNPSRSGILAALERMGARVRRLPAQEAWEPAGALEVASSQLKPLQLSASEAPGVIDELPILMVAAACARGTSRFEGVGELRVKETDRMQSMVSGLQALGAAARIVDPQTIEVDGGGPLRGAVVDSAGDHRTAMSLAVAGLAAAGRTTIRGAECVAKSFPEFFSLLGALAGSATVKSVDRGGALC